MPILEWPEGPALDPFSALETIAAHMICDFLNPRRRPGTSGQLWCLRQVCDEAISSARSLAQTAGVLFHEANTILDEFRKCFEAACSVVNPAQDKNNGSRRRVLGGSKNALRLFLKSKKLERLRDWSNGVWQQSRAAAAKENGKPGRKPGTSRARHKEHVEKLRATDPPTKWNAIVEIMNRDFPRPSNPWTYSKVRQFTDKRNK